MTQLNLNLDLIQTWQEEDWFSFMPGGRSVETHAKAADLSLDE
jgi:hypothetical protein